MDSGLSVHQGLVSAMCTAVGCVTRVTLRGHPENSSSPALRQASPWPLLLGSGGETGGSWRPPWLPLCRHLISEKLLFPAGAVAQPDLASLSPLCRA